MTGALIPPLGYDGIQAGIVDLLQAARGAAARSVNALMTASYWEIGRRIVEFEQGGAGRAEYGDALIQRLAQDLTERFGRGFSRQNLQQMRTFYLAWPTQAIRQTVSGISSTGTTDRLLHDKSVPAGNAPTQSAVSGLPAISIALSRKSIDLAALAKAFPLPWSAYVRLLSVKNQAACRFYETEALRCGWSVRQLDRQIDSQFYERIALSRNKAKMLETSEQAGTSDVLTPEEVIRDPFVLEFLGRKGKGAAEAHYALEGLPNKVLAAEYQTVLPGEKLLAEELMRTRRELEARRLVGQRGKSGGTG